MSDATKELLEILDLERIDRDLYRGFTPVAVGLPRLFGGQVLAQALMAAARTVEDRAAHSLHAYFLRPGDPKIPILFQVDRIRDGRSFQTRCVSAIQEGEAILHMSVSFQAEEPGLEHHFEMPPGRPDPETLATFEELRQGFIVENPQYDVPGFTRELPIDMRYTGTGNLFEPTCRPPFQSLWIRARGPLPDDPIVHQCALAFASDYTILGSSILPHEVGVMSPGVRTASIDHAMWFHRPFRADEWMLFEQDSPSSSNGRGFSRGCLFARDGRLVASCTQEGLIRVARAQR
jgi:acyl-CoA thioesterase-2